MARKNARQTDKSNVYLFDTRTNSVMVKPKDDIKEKVASVREVVESGRSTNEIVMVLQYYDNNVEQTIQAFLEDGAKEALGEWNFSGKKPKPNNKKKKNRNKNKDKEKSGEDAVGMATPVTTAATPASSGPTRTGESPVPELLPADTPPLINGHVPTTNHEHEASVPAHSADDNKPTPVIPAQKNNHSTHHATGHQGNKASRPKTLSTGPTREQVLASTRRERTISEVSNSSSLASSRGTDIKTLHLGMEKSVRDLQRQTSSLQRHKLMLNEEIERSFKHMSKVFEDIRNALNDREAELMYAMDKVKEQALDVLSKRQKQSATLKQCTERAQAMKEGELGELRADIKMFVSDRKYDEELSQTTRFVCDPEAMLETVRNFGQVVPLRCAYNQRRLSGSSVASSIDDPMTPTTPSTPGLLRNVPSPLATGVNGHVSHSRPESQAETPPSQGPPQSVSKPSQDLHPSERPHMNQNSGSDKKESEVKIMVRGQGQGHKPEVKPMTQEEKDERAAALKKTRNARRRQKTMERRKNQQQSTASQGQGQPNHGTPAGAAASGPADVTRPISNPERRRGQGRGDASRPTSSPARGQGQGRGQGNRPASGPGQAQDHGEAASQKEPRVNSAPADTSKISNTNSNTNSNEPHNRSGSPNKGRPGQSRNRVQRSRSRGDKSSTRPAAEAGKVVVNGHVDKKPQPQTNGPKQPEQFAAATRPAAPSDKTHAAADKAVSAKVSTATSSPDVSTTPSQSASPAPAMNGTGPKKAHVSIQSPPVTPDNVLPQRKPRQRNDRRNEVKRAEVMVNGSTHEEGIR